MKTTTFLLLLAMLVTVSCRKNKDKPPPPPVITHVNMDIYTYDGVGDAGEMIWYASHKIGRNSINEIAADKSLEGKITFGYYKDDKEYGLYAPAKYPVMFGQEKWKVQNNTVFKMPAFNTKKFNESVDINPDEVTMDFIDKECKDAIIIGNKVNNLKYGDVFMFEIEGKMKGVVRVRGFYSSNKIIILETWIKQ
jgi:hypothetical protein